jgi:hypothetical protein
MWWFILGCFTGSLVSLLFISVAVVSKKADLAIESQV